MICLAGKVPVNEIKNYFDSAINSYKLISTGEKSVCFIWGDWEGDGEFHIHVAMKS